MVSLWNGLVYQTHSHLTDADFFFHLALLPEPDKGWAVKQARPSKKVWCSGLELCLEMSPVFDFGQGLRCGLFIGHCRCCWIMAARVVFLHFFLVPLCWYAVSERQMLLFFARGLVGVDKHLFEMVSLVTSMTLPLNHIFVLLLANLWSTVNSKPPTMPFGIVACTFSDNLSRNSCIRERDACAPSRKRLPRFLSLSTCHVG